MARSEATALAQSTQVLLANRLKFHSETVDRARGKTCFTPEEYFAQARTISESLVILQELSGLWGSIYGAAPTMHDVYDVLMNAEAS